MAEPSVDNLRPAYAAAMPFLLKASQFDHTNEQISRPVAGSGMTPEVIVGGGIVGARGIVAALALGAVGVQVGTAYLLCPEATPGARHHAAHKSDPFTRASNFPRLLAFFPSIA
jgi:hypothetical protein